ncbi:hypothetical protein ACQKP0_20605 [Heyndrickxia sp. NPDC080065]|uniref:hypothetical protein n=1 Tax=Heyndrickxia sp. NPDC080065 TaxID=3390568 RepID=UPI003D08A9C2
MVIESNISQINNESHSWEEYSEVYSKIRLSQNQVKRILNQSLQPLKYVNIEINNNEKLELKKEQIVELLLINLKRNEVVELIHMLQLILGRKSEISSYIKYILIGILSNNNYDC